MGKTGEWSCIACKKSGLILSEHPQERIILAGIYHAKQSPECEAIPHYQTTLEKRGWEERNEEKSTIRPMTPQEVYALPSQSITHRVDGYLRGCYYNHIIEAGSNVRPYSIKTKWEWEIERIETRIIHHFDFDDRRYWRLASVWFDHKPVMILQNAGREGDDHACRFITDERRFIEMCLHIRSLIDLPSEESEMLKPDESSFRLVAFYDHGLGGKFEKWEHGLSPDKETD